MNLDGDALHYFRLIKAAIKARRTRQVQMNISAMLTNLRSPFEQNILHYFVSVFVSVSIMEADKKILRLFIFVDY